MSDSLEQPAPEARAPNVSDALNGVIDAIRDLVSTQLTAVLYRCRKFVLVVAFALFCIIFGAILVALAVHDALVLVLPNPLANVGVGVVVFATGLLLVFCLPRSFSSKTRMNRG